MNNKALHIFVQYWGETDILKMIIDIPDIYQLWGIYINLEGAILLRTKL